MNIYRSMHTIAYRRGFRVPFWCIYRHPATLQFINSSITTASTAYSLHTLRASKMGGKVLLISAVLVGLVSLSSCRSLGELDEQKTYSSAPHCIFLTPSLLCCIVFITSYCSTALHLSRWLLIAAMLIHSHKSCKSIYLTRWGFPKSHTRVRRELQTNTDTNANLRRYTDANLRHYTEHPKYTFPWCPWNSKEAWNHWFLRVRARMSAYCKHQHHKAMVLKWFHFTWNAATGRATQMP
jgi:hypothetical protein